MTDLFLATVQATEEAIANAMVATETMKVIDGLRETLKKYIGLCAG